jgi:hypothetical protein
MVEIPEYQLHAPDIYNIPTHPYAKQKHLGTNQATSIIDQLYPSPNQDSS